MCSARSHVCFGSRADMCDAKHDFRSTPESRHSETQSVPSSKSKSLSRRRRVRTICDESGHSGLPLECPLSANSGHARVYLVSCAEGAVVDCECPLRFRLHMPFLSEFRSFRPKIGVVRSRAFSITSARDIGLRGVPRTAETRSERRLPSDNSISTMATRTGSSFTSLRRARGLLSHAA